MRKALLAFSLLALTSTTFGQARLVINNDAWVVIDGGAWVVLKNNATNAITVAGTGANIKSESEFDRIRWQMGATLTGLTYSIPFTSSNGIKIPLTYVKQSTGAGHDSSSVIFSTYNHVASGGTWDNFPYRPSDVTHMNNYTTGTTLTPGATNESGHVVDRFWIMDTKIAPYAFATNPNAQATFTYYNDNGAPDIDDVRTGNTIIWNSPVNPQRFNNLTNRWGDYLPGAVSFTAGALGGVNTVVSNPVAGAQWYRSWTLSDVNDPLPIELTELKAECDNNRVVVSWTTATETDNAYFTVQRSLNGVEWTDLGTVNGSGTTTVSHTYTWLDNSPIGLAYYRLIQTDNDGDWSSSNMVPGGCASGDGLNIVSVYDAGDDNVTILVSSTFSTQFDVSLIDASGKMLGVMNSQPIAEGITQLKIAKGTLATGVYMVRLSNADQVLTGRVVLN